VRCCRVLLVKDAVNVKKENLRVAQVTVWDAEALGKELLVEGKTYMVSIRPWRSHGRGDYDQGSPVSTGHEPGPTDTKRVDKAWGEGRGVSGYKKGYKMEEGCDRTALIFIFSSRAQVRGQ
jgi:hypothetical protein